MHKTTTGEKMKALKAEAIELEKAARAAVNYPPINWRACN